MRLGDCWLERVIAAIIAENIFLHTYMKGDQSPRAGRPLCRQFDCPPMWHASRLPASRNGKQLMLQLLMLLLLLVLLLTHCNCIVALCRPTHHCPLVWPLLSFLSSYRLCTAKEYLNIEYIFIYDEMYIFERYFALCLPNCCRCHGRWMLSF